MRIDSAQLTAFAAVLGEGTFDLASRKLNVTPSAISQRIRQLEDRIGQVLIQRTTPCQATAAGQVLLRYAEQLALLESEAITELGLADADAHAPVRIPVVVNVDSLDSWFAEIFDSLPGIARITLDIRTEDQDHSAALLREGTVMAGVSASVQSIQGCTVEPLGVMRYLAVASQDFLDRFFAAGVNEQSLKTAPMLMFNKKDGLQKGFASLFTSVTPNPPTHFVPSTRSFLEASRRGVAWGMVPEPLVSASLRSGELVEIAAHYWLDVPLYWHRWRIASSALDTVTALVHQAARKTLRQT